MVLHVYRHKRDQLDIRYGFLKNDGPQHATIIFNNYFIFIWLHPLLNFQTIAHHFYILFL